MRALKAIIAHRPQVVALERLFAATSRGAALINRIKADPSLAFAEIRIVSHDSDYSRVSPRRQAAPAAPAVQAQAEAAAPAALDYSGTRRAARVRMLDGTEAQVDGTLAALVDLSVIGAQVVSPNVLRPSQGLRVTLADEAAIVRFAGSVAWSSFEVRKGTPRYRGGIEFRDADAAAVQEFLKRHGKA